LDAIKKTLKNNPYFMEKQGEIRQSLVDITKNELLGEASHEKAFRILEEFF